MINLPYVNLPDNLVRLMSSNIQNTSQLNNNLEQFIIENKELNFLIKKIFKDIDPDGFLGKIISIVGWTGVRNRLAAIYLDYSINGYFPDSSNLNLVTDIINLENKLRHFTITGYSRAFLLGFYSKMSVSKINHMEEIHNFTPLIIKEEIIELLKYSKSKSVKIDWLILQLVLFESVLGIDRLNSLMKSEIKFNALFNLLKEDEKTWFVENLLQYGASIMDYEFFLIDSNLNP